MQTHIHLCQTLFRGIADDLPLLDWLKRRVWPLEAAHRPIRCAPRLASPSHELLRTGTTSVLTMETVHDTDAVLETLAETGIRATVGKCLMDRAGDAPARLQEDRARGLEESLALHKQWHGAGERTAAHRARAALRGVVLARAARGGRGGVGGVGRAGAHARVGEPRRGRAGARAVGAAERRLPRRGRARRRRISARRTASGSTITSRR